LCALQQTDKRNAEYEAWLNVKQEKLRQQLKYFEDLQQNIVELNHELDSNSNIGIDEVGTFGILRQNTNYRSLPMGAKLWSQTDDNLQQIGQRIDMQHCLYTQKLDMSPHEDETNSSKNTVDPSNGNNVNFSASMVKDVTSSSSFPPAGKWSLQSIMDNGISHSENLRNTSYRMIGRFATQHGDMRQSLASYLPSGGACNTSVSVSDSKSSDVTRCLPLATGSLHVKPPVTVNEPWELEHTLQSKDVADSSLQPETDEHSPDISHPLSRLSLTTDRCGEPVLLPDVISPLSDNITLQNVVEHDKVSRSGSNDTMPTLILPAASNVPPPVAQKPKFRYPHLAAYDVKDSDGIAVSTQPTLIPATPHGSVDILSTSTSFSLRQDFPPETSQLKNMSDEPPASNSGDDDGQDLTDSNKLVSRLTYKPSIVYPVRRRRPSVGEGCQFSSSCPSGDLQGKEEMVSVTEDSTVCSEGNISRVQTVKNKLRQGMSRRVQFEPLALLLDAALEGEIDLLQSTLKV